MNVFGMSNPADPDSVPDFDSWGPDIYAWTAYDWIQWHQANVAKYGIDHANDVFVSQWNQQTFGAGPLNEFTNDSTIRQYFRDTGLMARVPSSLGGAVTDAASTATNVSGAVADVSNQIKKTTALVGWAVPVGLLVIGLLWIFPPKSKIDSARALFNK